MCVVGGEGGYCVWNLQWEGELLLVELALHCGGGGVGRRGYYVWNLQWGGELLFVEIAMGG